MNKLIPILFVPTLLTPCPPARADVAPNGLFGNNAVLQQERRVPVWGTAAEGEKVTVAFAGQKAETVQQS